MDADEKFLGGSDHPAEDRPNLKPKDYLLSKFIDEEEEKELPEGVIDDPIS